MNIRESITNENMSISKSQILKNLQKINKLKPEAVDTSKKSQMNLMETISNMHSINEIGETPSGKQALQRYTAAAEKNITSREKEIQQKKKASAKTKLMSTIFASQGYPIQSKKYENVSKSFASDVKKLTGKNYRRAVGVLRARKILGFPLKEQLLNELEKRTYSTYIRKSTDQMNMYNKLASLALQRASSGSADWKTSNVSDYIKYSGKAKKRAKGIETAKELKKRG